MSFSNQSSLKGTLQQLKEIIICLQGEEHESTYLLIQMEKLAIKIENQVKQSNSGQLQDSVTIVKPPITPVQITS